ncbi:hypothetical protein HPB51_008734 [Rhipicephalus microplus]|uniref:Receptor ligand binding region domain-containing protein n=1 Tax=Rhipicephalus microplus TaxID=6941 RepID=A0A9J6DFY3_RHIMP|nr:hypothetical protein HPB51_008734 [Rhipicephalus microplus]
MSPEEQTWLLQALEKLRLNISGASNVAAETLKFSAVDLNAVDILRSSKKLCGLLEQGVLAVLAPLQRETSSLVRTACFRHRITHFYSHRDDDTQWRIAPDSVSITLSPSPVELSRALQDLVEAQRWTHFTLIYERPEALVQLRRLLDQRLSSDAKLVPVSLHMLTVEEDPRPLLREIAKSGDTNLVLDLTAERLAEVLNLHTSQKMVTLVA